MGVAANVYAKELSTYGYGHPLWCPEPFQRGDGRTRHIHLGDVGFIDEDGGFRSLFNITVDDKHELNASGVPEGFQPVEVHDNLKTVRDGFLHPGPLCSEAVRARSATAGAFVGTTVAGGNLSYTFKCCGHRGAFLVLDDYATKAAFSPNLPFKQYMLEHHTSWYAFATDRRRWGLQCDPEDIILVRGTMKTSSWRVGAFFGHTRRIHNFAVDGQVPPFVGAEVQLSSEYSESHKWEQRKGPYRALPSPALSQAAPITAAPGSTNVNAGDPHPQVNQPVKDQCIFLSYYKIKRRPFLPKRIEARADSPSLDGPPGEEGGSERPSIPTIEVDVESDSNYEPSRGPVDDVLDYILEYSDAAVAIASDIDVQYLFPNSRVPSDLAAALRGQKPRIIVDEFRAGQLAITTDTTDVPSIDIETADEMRGSTSDTSQSHGNNTGLPRSSSTKLKSSDFYGTSSSFLSTPDLPGKYYAASETYTSTSTMSLPSTPHTSSGICQQASQNDSPPLAETRIATTTVSQNKMLIDWESAGPDHPGACQDVQRFPSKGTYFPDGLKPRGATSSYSRTSKDIATKPAAPSDAIEPNALAIATESTTPPIATEPTTTPTAETLTESNILQVPEIWDWLFSGSKR